MSYVQLVLSSRRALDLRASKGLPALRKFANLLQGALAGTNMVDGWLLQNNVSAQYARALALYTFSTGVGVVGSIINGTTVSVTWGTSDTATAAALVAAINASTTVNPIVMATKYFGILTPTTAIAGDTVNVCGWLFTGVAGTADYAKGQFSIDTDDTATALDLGKAINATPGLNQKVAAMGGGAACYLALIENRAARSDEILSSTTSTIVPTAFAAGARYFVIARQPGFLGNCVTATATGTNLAVGSAVSGKLGSGTGGYLSTGQYLTSDTK